MGKLGSGSYGKVYRVATPEGVAFAKKVVDTPTVAEIDILSSEVLQRCPTLCKALDISINEETGNLEILFPLYSKLKLHRSKPWQTTDTLKLVSDITQALEALYNSGWYHRDVKPENVMFDPVSKRYILIDMGLAIRTTAEHTHTEMTCTESYRPPMMLEYPGRYPVDVPFDMFGLAFTVMHCLCTREQLRKLRPHNAVKILKGMDLDHIHSELKWCLMEMLKLKLTLFDVREWVTDALAGTVETEDASDDDLVEESDDDEDQSTERSDEEGTSSEDSADESENDESENDESDDDESDDGESYPPTGALLAVTLAKTSEAKKLIGQITRMCFEIGLLKSALVPALTYGLKYLENTKRTESLIEIAGGAVFAAYDTVEYELETRSGVAKVVTNGNPKSDPDEMKLQLALLGRGCCTDYDIPRLRQVLASGDVELEDLEEVTETVEDIVMRLCVKQRNVVTQTKPVTPAKP